MGKIIASLLAYDKRRRALFESCLPILPLTAKAGWPLAKAWPKSKSTAKAGSPKAKTKSKAGDDLANDDTANVDDDEFWNAFQQAWEWERWEIDGEGWLARWEQLPARKEREVVIDPWDL